jgi:hypothetical protein
MARFTAHRTAQQVSGWGSRVASCMVATYAWPTCYCHSRLPRTVNWRSSRDCPVGQPQFICSAACVHSRHALYATIPLCTSLRMSGYHHHCHHVPKLSTPPCTSTHRTPHHSTHAVWPTHDTLNQSMPAEECHAALVLTLQHSLTKPRAHVSDGAAACRRV